MLEIIFGVFIALVLFSTMQYWLFPLIEIIFRILGYLILALLAMIPIGVLYYGYNYEPGLLWVIGIVGAIALMIKLKIMWDIRQERLGKKPPFDPDNQPRSE